MQDIYDLARFVTAQADRLDAAREELSAGKKRTHWIWYIFPQLQGLGSRAASQFFGIGGLGEAKAYLAHPVLGPRLEEVTRLVLAQGSRTLHDIFGAPDDLKFRSSMTLFAEAAGTESIFARALAEKCGGERDKRTLALLRKTQ